MWPWRSAEARPRFHTRPDCVSVLVGSFFETFSRFSNSCQRNRSFPAENIFDICFALPSALGINEKTASLFFSCLEFITSVDIYLPWTEISADTCDTLHPANHIDWRPPERNASTVHTCSLLSNMGYFFLSPCPHLLMNYVVVEKP